MAQKTYEVVVTLERKSWGRFAGQWTANNWVSPGLPVASHDRDAWDVWTATETQSHKKGTIDVRHVHVCSPAEELSREQEQKVLAIAASQVSDPVAWLNRDGDPA